MVLSKGRKEARLKACATARQAGGNKASRVETVPIDCAVISSPVGLPLDSQGHAPARPATPATARGAAPPALPRPRCSRRRPGGPEGRAAAAAGWPTARHPAPQPPPPLRAAWSEAPPVPPVWRGAANRTVMGPAQPWAGTTEAQERPRAQQCARALPPSCASQSAAGSSTRGWPAKRAGSRPLYHPYTLAAPRTPHTCSWATCGCSLRTSACSGPLSAPSSSVPTSASRAAMLACQERQGAIGAA